MNDTNTVFVLSTINDHDGISNTETIGVYEDRKAAREELKRRRDIFVNGLEEGERLEDLSPMEDSLKDTEDFFGYLQFSAGRKFQLEISEHKIIKKL